MEKLMAMLAEWRRNPQPEPEPEPDPADGTIPWHVIHEDR